MKTSISLTVTSAVNTFFFRTNSQGYIWLVNRVVASWAAKGTRL
jgi:hypothetical protein